MTADHKMPGAAAHDPSQTHEMIGQVTGGVADDFNHLLTVIEAGHQLIGQYAADARIARVLEVNRLAMDKSRRLIAQLLAFSGRQMLKPAPVDVNATVSVFDRLIDKAIGDRRAVQWRLGENLPLAHADPAQLQAALLNLLVNARDAVPPGGTITIFTGTERRDTAPPQPGFAGPEGLFVVLGVSDTGTGMPADVAARAVEPFFTTKGAGEARGLGLSQVFGFARQSGGTMEIASGEGTGTTVRILLPALQGGDAAEPGRTILLVNDDDAFRALVAEMLRRLGHTVFEAEDARDALNQLQTSFAIEQLFTDIIMPDGIHGLELVDEALGLRALLASGYKREVLCNLARLQDDVMVLRKPWTIDRPEIMADRHPR